MKMTRFIFVIVVVVLLFVVSCGSSSYTTEQLDALATCIADTDTKVYGAFWCPNCAKQKKMLKHGWEILLDAGVYVECDPRGDNAQPDLCIEKMIEKYPTWEFGSGTELIVQVFEIDELAVRTGCEDTLQLLKL
jgi:hypothetical protein